MTTQTAIHTRRTMLGTVAGAVAGAAAGVISRPSSAAAHDGDVHLGTTNTATATTSIDTNSATAFEGRSRHGTGVSATSTNGSGLHAYSGGEHAVHAYGTGGDGTAAVYAQHGGSRTGVFACSGGFPPEAPRRTGVFGVAEQDATSRGVWGRSNHGHGVLGDAPNGVGVGGRSEIIAVQGTSGSGTGVQGESTRGPGVHATSRWSDAVRADTESGIGVRASSTHHTAVRGVSSSPVHPAIAALSKGGLALLTNGRIELQGVSGRATIPAGLRQVTIRPGVLVAPTSFALVSPQVDVGTRSLWSTTSPTDNTITVHISSAPSTATEIAWLLLG